MSRPLIRIACSVVSVGLLLAGTTSCGTKSNATTKDSNGAITLTMWHGFTGSDGPALEKVIDDFNASQEDVKVSSKVYPWDSLYDKFLTSVTSNSAPQIVAMSDSRLAQYAAKKALQPTTDFYKDKTYMDTSVLAQSAIEASEYNGINYGAPLNIGPILLYWNKDLFTKAGLDPEKPPTTWDEFAEAAKKLTVDENHDGKPEQYAIAIGDHETVPIYPSFLAQAGGGLVSKDGKKSILNDGKTLSAAKYWVDLVKTENITPLAMSGADADQLFQSGKAAMELNGPWLTNGLTEAKLNFGVGMPFKDKDSSKQIVMTDAVSFAVPRTDNDEQRAAAYKFFAYWNSKQGQTTWANNSGFPPDRADIDASDLTNKYTQIFGDAKVLDSMVMYMPGVPVNQQIDKDIFIPALQKALNGESTVDDLFGKASTDIQSALDEVAQ